MNAFKLWIIPLAALLELTYVKSNEAYGIHENLPSTNNHNNDALTEAKGNEGVPTQTQQLQQQEVIYDEVLEPESVPHTDSNHLTIPVESNEAYTAVNKLGTENTAVNELGTENTVSVLYSSQDNITTQCNTSYHVTSSSCAAADAEYYSVLPSSHEKQEEGLTSGTTGMAMIHNSAYVTSVQDSQTDNHAGI